MWGEASDTIHALIHNIVESRLRVVGQQAGRQGRAKNLADLRSHLVGSLRRQVSFLAVRAILILEILMSECSTTHFCVTLVKLISELLLFLDLDLF